MPETPPVTITLRIPGVWPHPRELVESLPAGCRIRPDAIKLPDGSIFALDLKDADAQFAQIFRSSCRQPATPDEWEKVKNYKVNVCISGPGGSKEAALAVMKAGVAIMDAGGAGVFIDNCGLAHGATAWKEMAADGGPDALSFAFVSIIRGKLDVWTMGMHALGYREIVMSRIDIEKESFDIIEVLRYVAAGEKPMEDGHIIMDLEGPRFKAVAEPSNHELAGSVMHNPFGQLRLVRFNEAAERN